MPTSARMLDLCWIRERPRKRTLGRASEVESSGRPQVMSRGRCFVISCADCFSLVWRLLALCALQIYDLFTKVLDRLKHDKDAQGVGYLEQAVELWTSMMIEEHEHDDWCLNNIHDMQEECEAWLLELQSELDAKDGGEASAAIVTKPTAARATRSAPPPPVSPASSPSNPSEKPVTMTMKLGMDFAKAGKEGSPERAKFEQQLVADLKRTVVTMEQRHRRNQAAVAVLDDTKQRLSAQTQSATGLRSQCSELQSQLDECAAREAKAAGRAERLKARADDLEQQLGEASEAAAAAKEQAAALRSRVEQEREALRDVQRDLAQQKSRARVLEQQHTAAIAEGQSLRQRIVGLVRSV